MAHTSDDLVDVHPGRQILALSLAVIATLPGIIVRFTEPELSAPIGALLFGLAIVGAAFVLAWAAEVAQLDISAGLAIAVLALIAVLPEYAVDLVFAWRGGEAYEMYGAACGPAGVDYNDTPCSFALANMTGANRLLIGVGWSMVVLVAWFRVRTLSRRRATSPERVTPAQLRGLENQSGRGITLDRGHTIEVAFLAAATIYSLTLPLKTSITLIDAAVLVGIFVLYTIRISKAPAEEPHLVGPARYLGTFRDAPRRVAVVTMFVFAAAVILLCAEHFADALVESGEAIGVPAFFLVQWLAPLASEAPELLVAALYAWRLNTSNALGTLVSSKVNQWTLLVGTLPIVFAISAGELVGLPLDSLQREELFLTAAQSFFAVALLGNLSLGVREALALAGLFFAQFVLGAVVPEQFIAAERIGLGILYLVLGGVIFLRDRKRLPHLLHDGFRAPYAELMAESRNPTPPPS
jgi:cation:H+ antiporter